MSLDAAVALAEKSAADAAAAPELQESVTGAIMTAGAALSGVHGFEGHEPTPAEEHAATIASFVAKVAEWAARAAMGPANESARASLEAYTFARDAAHAAEEGELIREMQREFDSLHRVATQGKWSHSTPVEPSVFGPLSDEGRGRSWWRSWRRDA